jgi:hypothetical protein
MLAPNGARACQELLVLHCAGCVNPMYQLAQQLGLDLIPTDYEDKVTYVPSNLAEASMPGPNDAAVGSKGASLAQPVSNSASHRLVSELSIALTRQLTAGNTDSPSSFSAALTEEAGMWSQPMLRASLMSPASGCPGARFHALPPAEVAASGQVYLQLEQYMRRLSTDPVLRQGMSVQAAMQMFCTAAPATGITQMQVSRPNTAGCQSASMSIRML